MTSHKLARFGVSMDEKLLQSFDDMIEEKGYPNRSEAVRDLVREAILQHKWMSDTEMVAGAILLFYDHHHNHLLEEMTNIQHEYYNNILATTHFHLDHHHCLEVIVVKGLPSDLKTLSDKLITLKGVYYGKLTISPLTGN